jgi:hypothetical protein
MFLSRPDRGGEARITKLQSHLQWQKRVVGISNMGFSSAGRVETVAMLLKVVVAAVAAWAGKRSQTLTTHTGSACEFGQAGSL